MENLNNNGIKNSGRVWSGLIIILVGMGFLLNNVGLDIPNWIFSFWTFLIVLGLFLGFRKNFKGIGWLVIVLIGVYNTIDRMGFDFDISKYALGFGLVIVGGFLILRPKNGFKNSFVDQSSPTDFSTQTAIESGQAQSRKANTNDVIDVTAVFGGNNQTVYSKNFKGGDITAVFGGTDIILTQADFEETALLDVTAIFGGIKLIVPQDWAIKSNVTAIFGSVEDKRSHFMPIGERQKTLVLVGTAMFGGIEIKSF
ncbi:LiaF transmembrane domain-containing protein [Pedobacter sandarakinus]|uniref:LiaF transmembrane domain-containing protein n=1 Tax=Pedobacter sandarakinus TaxID=353156 RepID=UPI002246C929|nr:LiaF domain-containing protein [Pedobacter sandarakinus]MCX2574998.1 LiaF-related protein [Pedobacter sandarakinus]